MVKGNYYGVLGVSPEASEEEIKNRFNELSLTAHPDKGGDEEKYKKIQNVYKVLGSPHQRLKYDLCLLKNSDYEYIESEKWGTTYRSDETISDELFWKIVSLLKKELELNELNEQELSDYGQKKNSVVLESGSYREVKPIVNFCRSKLKGKTLSVVVERTKNYLETIQSSSDDKKDVGALIEEEIMLPGELSAAPLLTKKELDDYDGHNEYDSYYEKVREEILRKTFKNRREKVLKTKENYTKIIEPLKEKIKQRREKKQQLLGELDTWLKDGEKILTDEAENKQEQITNFINDFSDYLNEKKESADYPTKIISQNTQKDKKSEIDGLITRLENWKEEEEVHGEGEEEFSDPSPISSEEKQDFIKYLDNLLFDWLAPLGTPKNPSSLKRIRNNNGLVYEDELKNSNNKGEAEIIRVNTIKNICEIVSNTGGSDEELVKRVKKINTNFIYKISSEIEKQLGIKISSLPQEEQDLLFKPKKGELSQVGFAKKLIKQKAIILENNIRISWQIKAISEVNDYWTNNQTGGRINEQTKEEILGTNWENKVRAKSTEEEINNERNNLKSLIDNAKALETVKKWQNIAIEEVEKHWKNNSNDGKLSGKVNQKTIGQVLGKENWQESIQNKNTKNEINACLNYFKGLINNSKRDEIKAQEIAADSSYDDLLSQINNETNQSADYEQRINNLDWAHMTGSRIKTDLMNAWSSRKSHLVEKARREQEQRKEEARQRQKQQEQAKKQGQDEKKQKKREEKEKKAKLAYDDLLNKISNETDESANYTSHINNLDWTCLVSPQTKDALISAWNNRKNFLANETQKKKKVYVSSEERRLSESLVKLLGGERTKKSGYRLDLIGLTGNIRGDIKVWFEELIEFLQNNSSDLLRMLEKTHEEVSDDEKREIFSELEKEKDLITRNEGEFKKSSYLEKVNSRHKSLLLRKYLQQIFRTIRERKLSEWENEIEGDDINSIMEEVKKIEEEFVSNAKTSQEKIKGIIEKLSRNFVDKAKKNEGDLIDEKRVMDAITNLVEKIEEVREAIKVAKEVISNYSDGKDLSKEEVKKWISELETRNFKNSREVSQYLNSLVSGSSGSSGSMFFIVAGIIFILILCGSMVAKILSKRKGTKNKSNR